MDPKALGEGIKNRFQRFGRENKKEIPKLWEERQKPDSKGKSALTEP